MSSRTPTKRQREFSSGRVGRTFKEEARLSRFEALAQSLNLSEAEWSDSTELREFAQRYRNEYYVPEKLLSEWGITTIYSNDSPEFALQVPSVAPSEAGAL